MKILKCASIIPELNSKNLEIPSENTKYGGKGPVKKETTVPPENTMLLKLMQWREIAAPSESNETTIPSDDTKYTSKVAAVRRKPTNCASKLTAVGSKEAAVPSESTKHTSKGAAVRSKETTVHCENTRYANKTAAVKS